jgi:hypothetical protein
MDVWTRLEPKLREFVELVESLCGQVRQCALEEERPGLREVEIKLREACHALGHEATEVVVEGYGTGRVGNRRSCACGGTQRYKVTVEKEMLDLHGGTLHLERAYYYCESCRQGFLPLDEQLGLGQEQMTPALSDLVQLMGVVAPFEESSRLIKQAVGVEVSRERVRRATERAGQRCLEADQAEAEHSVSSDTPDDGVMVRRERSSPEDCQYVMVDGGMVPTVEGWREVKLGVCFRADSRVEISEGRTVILRKRFFGDMISAESFGQRLYAAVRREGVGVDGCGCQMLGDGAEWIWNLKAEHLPQAEETVDWYHLKEKVWETAHVLLGEGSPAAEIWANRRLNDLWKERPTRVLKTLARARLDSKQASDSVTDLARYVHNNRDRMRYASRRRRGLLVGSGPIEGGIKYVLQSRLKRAGMRWATEGARQVLALRLRWLNGEWNVPGARPTASVHRTHAVA